MMKIKKKVQDMVDKVYNLFQENEKIDEYYSGVIITKDVFYYYTLALVNGFDYFLPNKSNELIKNTYEAYLFNDLEVDYTDTKVIIEYFNNYTTQIMEQSKMQNKEEKIRMWKGYIGEVMNAFKTKISA